MGKQICVYIEEGLVNKIKELAKKENRSFSSMLNILLNKLLNKKNE